MRIASGRGHTSRLRVRVLPSLLHSRCYDAQHLKSGLFAAPLLRHLHGHCVVCYIVQCWLLFIVIFPVETKKNINPCCSSNFSLTDFMPLVACWQLFWSYLPGPADYLNQGLCLVMQKL